MKSIFLSLLLGTFALTSFAADNKGGKRNIGIERPNICLLLLHQALPKNAVNFAPFNGIASVKNINLNERSFEALKNMIRSEDTLDILYDTLVRLKLIVKNSEDPEDITYAEWQLIRQKGPLNLKDKAFRQDLEIQKLIELRKKYFSDELKNLDSLDPIPEDEKNELLLDQVLTLLAPFLDNSHSVKVLNSFFTNVQREFEAYKTQMGMSRAQFLTRLERLSEGIENYGVYIPKELEDMGQFYQSLTALPYLSTVYKVLNFLYMNIVSPKAKMKKQQIRVGTEKGNQKLQEGSMQLQITERDPHDLKRQAYNFISVYLNQDKNFSPYTKNFEYALAKAYPETELLFKNNYADSSLIQEIFPDGIYGQGSSELYKVIRRMAITIETLKGNHEQTFPFINQASFEKLRNLMINDLELKDANGRYDLDALDFFFTFMMLDAVGRGSDQHIKWISNYNKIDHLYGANFEHRTYALLKLDPFTSYSLAKRTNADQQSLIHLFHKVAGINVGQVVQLEAGPSSLKRFIGMNKDDIEMILFRYLFSAAGITFDSKITHSAIVNQELFDIGMMLYEELPKLAKNEITADFLYKKIILMKGQKLGIFEQDQNANEITDESIALIRLASQSRVNSKELYESLENEFKLLPNKDKEFLTNFFNKEPVISFYSATLSNVIRHRYPNQHDKEWLRIITAGLKSVTKHRRYEGAINQLSDVSELPIMFNRILDYTQNGTPLDQIHGDKIIAIDKDDYFKLVIPSLEEK